MLSQESQLETDTKSSCMALLNNLCMMGKHSFTKWPMLAKLQSFYWDTILKVIYISTYKAQICFSLPRRKYSGRWDSDVILSLVECLKCIKWQKSSSHSQIPPNSTAQNDYFLVTGVEVGRKTRRLRADSFPSSKCYEPAGHALSQ